MVLTNFEPFFIGKSGFNEIFWRPDQAFVKWNAQSGAEDCISRSNFATQKSLHFNISNFQVNSQADEKQQLVGKERPYVHH